MISLGARFADYGLTGGFFLFAQVILLTSLLPTRTAGLAETFAHQLTTLLAAMPEAVRPAITSLLAALAIISIFFIGLLLEALGSHFVIWEADIFWTHLHRNQPWIGSILAKYGAYLEQGWDSDGWLPIWSRQDLR